MVKEIKVGNKGGRPKKKKIETMEDFLEVKKEEGLEAYSRLVTEARSHILKSKNPKLYIEINKWVAEFGHGKSVAVSPPTTPAKIEFNFLSVGADGQKRIDSTATYEIEGTVVNE